MALPGPGEAAGDASVIRVSVPRYDGGPCDDVRAIGAVLFDLDGTLADTRPVMVAALRALVKAQVGAVSNETAQLIEEVVGLGFPAFWLGIMLLLVFGLHLGRLFPVGGYGEGLFGHLHSMFLPALTVALGISPILVRSLRAGLLEVLDSDYVTTARSKGLSERRVLVRHALRNAAVSTVSVLGVNIGYLVGGTLVIEQVYALPGVGQLMINSIFQRDFPVVQAVTLVFSLLVVLVYLLTDVAHALLDPRVRFE